MRYNKFRDAVAGVFRSHPNEWINAAVLQQVGGQFASRTRVSECRRQLGMTIQNRTRRMATHTPDCPAQQAWDIEGACQCGRSAHYVISEYRFVPAAQPEQADLFKRSA